MNLKQTNDIPENDPYSSIDWSNSLSNLLVNKQLIDKGRDSMRNRDKFRQDADEWLQYTRRLRHIMAFQQDKLQQGDITRFFQILMLAYAGIYGFVPAGASEPVSVKKYLEWFANARLGFNGNIEDLPRYTMFDTELGHAIQQMGVAFLVLERNNPEIHRYEHLQAFDYELFKSGSVFLGIASEGLYPLFSELVTIITEGINEEGRDIDEMVEAINSQMGLINIAVNKQTQDKILTLEENIKENIRKIIFQNEGDKIVIIIDEVLTEEGGGTFSIILEALIDEFGDELMPKIELYIADGYTLQYVVSEEMFLKKQHKWISMGHERTVPNESTGRPIRYKDQTFDPLNPK